MLGVKMKQKESSQSFNHKKKSHQLEKVNKQSQMEEERLVDYTPLEQIGAGPYSNIYRAMENVTGHSVALKIIDKTKFAKPSQLQYVQSEIAIMRMADHPNIIHLYEYVETPTKMNILMEYMPNGTLLDYINRNRVLEEHIACKFFAQMVDTLDYLHDVIKVVHRDLKAENFMIDSDGNLRLIDFGTSKNSNDAFPIMSTVCGNPFYAAPEMVMGQKYSDAVDVWSIGILLYAMLVGNLPFVDSNINKALNKILKDQPIYPPSIPPLARDLIVSILAKDPTERITLQEIKKHPWFTMNHQQPIYRVLLVDISSIDENILYQINPQITEQIRSDLIEGVYNHNTALYRLYNIQSIRTAKPFEMTKRPMSPGVIPFVPHKRREHSARCCKSLGSVDKQQRSSATNLLELPQVQFSMPSRIPSLNPTNSPLLGAPKTRTRGRSMSVGAKCFSDPTFSSPPMSSCLPSLICE